MFIRYFYPDSPRVSSDQTCPKLSSFSSLQKPVLTLLNSLLQWTIHCPSHFLFGVIPESCLLQTLTSNESPLIPFHTVSSLHVYLHLSLPTVALALPTSHQHDRTISYILCHQPWLLLSSAPHSAARAVSLMGKSDDLFSKYFLSTSRVPGIGPRAWDTVPTFRKFTV